MRVRSVRANELDLFVEAGSAPERREEVKRYVESMFAAGAMRPEWCFVAEEDGRLLGRVALWSLPGTDRPLALVLLDVPWDGEYVTTGRCLLDEALGMARSMGADELEHTLDDPPMQPQFQSHPERRSELLQGAGFRPVRETTRFEWRGDRIPTVPARLTYRTLEDVGEEAFVDAMAMVSEGTLDRGIQEERERVGPEAAARSFFEDTREIKHDPSWWQLAYDAVDGDLVGLVMPAEPPAFLTVNYVGVVPEARGRGYVDDLLAAGTATLLSAGAKGKPLRADTDVSNAPMAAAFRRAGWTEFARRREYAARLAPTYRFEWRGGFDNASLNALHAEAFGHETLDDDWVGQVHKHSLGWVCAYDDDGLVGFVNVPWDGAIHAFIVDTVVSARAARRGVGTQLIAAAVAGARAAGCEWLHVDFEDSLRRFYFEACGFEPTNAGLIAL